MLQAFDEVTAIKISLHRSNIPLCRHWKYERDLPMLAVVLSAVP